MQQKGMRRGTSESLHDGVWAAYEFPGPVDRVGKKDGTQRKKSRRSRGEGVNRACTLGDTAKQR